MPAPRVNPKRKTKAQLVASDAESTVPRVKPRTARRKVTFTHKGEPKPETPMTIIVDELGTHVDVVVRSNPTIDNLSTADEVAEMFQGGTVTQEEGQPQDLPNQMPPPPAVLDPKRAKQHRNLDINKSPTMEEEDAEQIEVENAEHNEEEDVEQNEEENVEQDKGEVSNGKGGSRSELEEMDETVKVEKAEESVVGQEKQKKGEKIVVEKEKQKEAEEGRGNVPEVG